MSAVMHVDEGAIVDPEGDRMFLTLRSGDEDFRFVMTPHALVASLAAGTRAYARFLQAGAEPAAEVVALPMAGRKARAS